MENNLERYLHDNPDLKKVQDCPEADILLWADENAYIRLREFDGCLLYTDYQLEDAKMWFEKVGETSPAPFKLLVQYNSHGEDFKLYARYNTYGDAVAMGQSLLEKPGTDIVDFDVIEDDRA